MASSVRPIWLAGHGHDEELGEQIMGPPCGGHSLVDREDGSSTAPRGGAEGTSREGRLMEDLRAPQEARGEPLGCASCLLE